MQGEDKKEGNEECNHLLLSGSVFKKKKTLLRLDVTKQRDRNVSPPAFFPPVAGWKLSPFLLIISNLKRYFFCIGTKDVERLMETSLLKVFCHLPFQPSPLLPHVTSHCLPAPSETRLSRPRERGKASSE